MSIYILYTQTALVLFICSFCRFLPLLDLQFEGDLYRQLSVQLSYRTDVEEGTPANVLPRAEFGRLTLE